MHESPWTQKQPSGVVPEPVNCLGKLERMLSEAGSTRAVSKSVAVVCREIPDDASDVKSSTRSLIEAAVIGEFDKFVDRVFSEPA